MSSDGFDGEILSEKLKKVNNSQQSIESLSRWCITHRKKAKQIVETWDKLFNSSQKEQCVSLLYLANDILQNSRRKGSEFVDEFWKVLPSALKRVCDKGDDSGKKVVSRLVDIWDERKVFGSRGQGLKDVMMGKVLPPSVVSNVHSQNLIKIIKKDAQAVRVKLMVGSMPEKVLMAYRAVQDEKNDEEATLKRCRDVLDNASDRGAEPSPSLEEIQQCIKELESVEETRSALVLQLREALQDQEAKLDVIRNQLQLLEAEHSAAVKVQKVYRSYRTRRRLADTAVVAEEMWWQAIDYAKLNHTTVSFFSFSKPESALSRWNRVSLNASKVGKGLSRDDKAQFLAFQHWIEAIDPRHRYGHSLHKYYDEWCKSDGGQPFFYWLDLGDGKNVDLKDCPRSTLRKQCIKYLGPQEREHYEYSVADGKIVHVQTGELLDTTQVKGEKWIFVMGTTKKLYAGVKKKGKFHHSSFLAGGTTLAAGRLDVEHGVLKSISAYSGHYRPTDESLDIFMSYLSESGVNLKEVQIHNSKEDDESYSDTKSNKQGSGELPADAIPSQLEAPLDGTSGEFKRTLSGGLPSSNANVPQKSILKRMNSKKDAKSYQLGHQLSMKWTSGHGPRIGCVADYPVELRLSALEFTDLSPRGSPRTPPTFTAASGLASPKVPVS